MASRVARAQRLSALSALTLAASGLLACGGQERGAFEDTVELRAFLEGKAQAPEDREGRARLNDAFARQVVRANGYRKEGVGEDAEDAWSPVVRRRDGGVEAADVTPWIDGGEIDDAGRFTPSSSRCDAAGPVSTEGLPEEALAIEDLQDRLTRLTCAIERLAGPARSLEWTGPSEAAVSIDEGAVLVNPRVLHIVLPAESAAAQPPGGSRRALASDEAPVAAAEGEGDEELIEALDPEEEDPGAQAVEHHPRPDSDEDDAAQADWCEKACETVCAGVIAGLLSCDSSSGEGDSSGCEGDTSDSADSSCRAADGGGRSGGRAAGIVSAALFAALALRRRRGRRAGAGIAALFLLLLAPAFARAQPPPPPPPPPAAMTAADAKKLLEEGTKKLAEKRYDEAIASFQASYNASPSAAALEGIADAQEGMGKTPQAIQTLEHMLLQFGVSLPPEKHKQVEADIARMRSELVTVKIVVTPPDATVYIDDEEMPSAVVAGPIQLGPGKHKFAASREGYARGARSLDLAAGSGPQEVSLTLPADQGYVEIAAPEPNYRIHIDGVDVGEGSYSGFIEPGKHTVTIYRENGPSRAYKVDIKAGQTVMVPGGEEETKDADAGDPSALYMSEPEPLEPEPEPASPQGSYFLASGGVVWGTARLYGFERGSSVPGVAISGRLGYRLFTLIGAEILMEYSYAGREDILTQSFRSDQSGDGLIDGNERFFDESPAQYAIHGVRFGTAVRFMSSHPRNRLVSTVGAGLFYQSIALSHKDIVWDSAQARYEDRGTFSHHYQGFGPFALFDVGFERSLGDYLLGAAAGLSIESVGSIDERPYDRGIDVRAGLSLRFGYSWWGGSQSRIRAIQ